MINSGISLLLFFGTIVLLVFSYKKFTYEDKPLGILPKIILTIPVVLTILFSVLVFISAYNPDYQYTKAQASVSYHVYSPIDKIDGRTISTIYITNKKLADKNNAIQLGYNIPLEEQLKGKPTSIILISQVGVEPTFDFDKFSRESTKDPNSMKPITLKMPRANKAYLMENKKTLIATTVTILTSDRVLIIVASPKASGEELIRLAESLK